MKRIKLKDRLLPFYSSGEEIMNMVTHIVGGGMAVALLIACLWKAWGDALALLCAGIYGVSMITLYTMSSLYHGLHTGTGKKVLQVLDHCTIYFLIAGTYTPIVLCGFRPVYPAIGWGLFFLEWGLATIAVTLTAIDLHKYKVFSMVCYIGLGWAVLPFLPQAMELLGSTGFWFLLSGGIAYTVGAILFGIGSKVQWMHSVFHIFVVLGSALQGICILFYIL